MRIHRLIPFLMLLIVVALTTMTTIKHSPIAVESGTAIAQEADEGQVEEEPVEAEGATSFPLIETKEERDYDLYLDAAEVERLAAEEQSGDGAITSASRVPVSFRHLRLPLPAGGIDHAVAGVATRNSGHGVIRLRGVPQNSTLILALLVWGEISTPQGGYPVGFAPVCNSGTIYQGFLYGTTQQPCWNPSGVYAGYIANVTPAILPGINGDYQVKGLNSAIGDNRSPWGDAAIPPPNNALPLSEGASLIVFYTHPLIPQNAQIYVHLGPQMFSGTHTATHFTFPIQPNMLIKHSRIGADGQVARASGAIGFPFSPNSGLRSFPPTSNEQTWIINSVPQQIQIKGDGAGLNRDSDWNGDDGEPLNKLWDSHTDVFLNSNFLAVNGGFFYSVRYVSQGDCIVWAAHILGIR